MRATMTALAFLLCGCAPGFSASDRTAIMDVIETQQKAWNAGDVQAFMAGYDRTDTIVFTSGGVVRRGFEATIHKYLKSYPDAATMGKLSFVIEEVRPLGPDAAWVLGRWALTETPKEGGGVFTLVFQRTANGWKCTSDHTSVEK